MDKRTETAMKVQPLRGYFRNKEFATKKRGGGLYFAEGTDRHGVQRFRLFYTRAEAEAWIAEVQ